MTKSSRPLIEYIFYTIMTLITVPLVLWALLMSLFIFAGFIEITSKIIEVL